MEPTDKLLAAILGMIDGTFWPCRDLGFVSSSVYCSQADYRSRGIAWTASAGTDRARREEREALGALVDDELVVRTSAAGDRVIHLKLTNLGEDRARKLVELPGLSASLKAVRRMMKLQRRSGEAVVDLMRPDEWWVREDTFVGKSYEEMNRERPACKSAVHATDRLLPAIIRGWLEVRADSHRHLFYRLTESGIDALRHPWPFDFNDAPVDVSHDPDGALVAVDRESCNSTRDRIVRNPPTTAGEMGPIPWAASLRPRRLLRKKPRPAAVGGAHDQHL